MPCKKSPDTDNDFNFHANKKNPLTHYLSTTLGLDQIIKVPNIRYNFSEMLVKMTFEPGSKRFWHERISSKWTNVHTATISCSFSKHFKTK